MINATPVQTTKGDTGAVATATTLTLTWGAAPTSGDTLILAMNSTMLGLKFTQTNVVWSYYVIEQATGISAVAIAIGRVFGSAGTSLAIAHPGGSTFVGAAVAAEFSGTNLYLDKQAGAVGTSVSPASGATATTAVASELWVGALGVRGTFSAQTTVFSAPTNSFSIVDQDNTTINTSNSDRSVCLLAQAVSSTGTSNAGATITSNSWAAQTMTFQESGTTTTTSGGFFIQ